MSVRQQRIEELVLHAIATLPDSFYSRKRILEACLDVLAAQSGLRPKVALMIYHLEEHERAQRELPLLFGRKEEE